MLLKSDAIPPPSSSFGSFSQLPPTCLLFVFLFFHRLRHHVLRSFFFPFRVKRFFRLSSLTWLHMRFRFLCPVVRRRRRRKLPIPSISFVPTFSRAFTYLDFGCSTPSSYISCSSRQYSSGRTYTARPLVSVSSHSVDLASLGRFTTFEPGDADWLRNDGMPIRERFSEIRDPTYCLLFSPAIHLLFLRTNDADIFENPPPGNSSLTPPRSGTQIR